MSMNSGISSSVMFSGGSSCTLSFDFIKLWNDAGHHLSIPVLNALEATSVPQTVNVCLLRSIIPVWAYLMLSLKTSPAICHF